MLGVRGNACGERRFTAAFSLEARSRASHPLEFKPRMTPAGAALFAFQKGA